MRLTGRPLGISIAVQHDGIIVAMIAATLASSESLYMSCSGAAASASLAVQLAPPR
jgi:hypothetical protein